MVIVPIIRKDSVSISSFFKKDYKPNFSELNVIMAVVV